MDYAQARHLMVESQVRTADVTDGRILRAMRSLPRERFVPPHLRSLAYADLDLEIAPGRRFLRPRDLAKLIQALSPKENERALELAGAQGYGAAVLAACCAEVTTLDPDPDLSFAARAAAEAAGVTNIKTVSTRPDLGWPDTAPYDLIFLNGATEIVPDSWLDQLATGGRLGVIVRDGAAGEARIYTKTAAKAAFRVEFNAAPPLTEGLTKAPGFTF